MTRFTYTAVIFLLIFPLSTYAKDAINWGSLSLDELQNLEVTSVSKKSERAFDAAAAIYVITKEDIRRSGATTIPEALRLAPGVQVARAGSNKWAISIRGFNDQFSNKLLVLMDGRSVYTPMFSGVYWDEQDTLIEDIKQIEVIRGPGASLWGANAVNGVINIITEDAINTQSKLATVMVGNQEKGLSTRVGGKLNNDLYYRVYAKYTDIGAERTRQGRHSGDDSNSTRLGFRVDWDKTENDLITLQGDAYSNDTNQNDQMPSLIPPFRLLARNHETVAGGNIMMKWKHRYQNGASSEAQFYVDNSHRSINYLKQNINTADVDFQHAFPLFHRNEITVGTGYRLIDDHFGTNQHIKFIPATRLTSLYNAFIQDRIHLIQEKLFLILGTKYEYNSYTASEIQPSARISYQPTTKQTLWGSVSRAVRTPNRAMDDLIYPVAGTPFGYASLVGNRVVGFPAAKSEELIAYEIGYRIQPAKDITLDVTGFYNDYNKLVSNYAVTPLSLTPANQNSGKAHGIELSSKWEINEKWDVSANYTFQKTSLNVADPTGVITGGKSPENQYTLTSHYKFPHKIEMTNLLYTVAKLPSINIPAYTRFDTLIAWKPKDYLELSVVGQNLFDKSHPEFAGFAYMDREWISRSVYGKVKVWF